MPEYNFADLYAAETLSPTASSIQSRQAPADRIYENASNAQILDLVGIYYGDNNLDLTWFKDEFYSEDITFSLVNNARETRVLSSAILAQLIHNENSVAILAVVTGNVSGFRPAKQAESLLSQANAALVNLAVAERKPKAIEPKVTPTITAKLTEEIAATAQNDWPALLTILGKIRAEAQSSSKTTSNQTATTLSSLNRQIRLQREELQMLWWLFAEHSRTFERHFSTLSPAQAAIIGGLDLGTLTSVTELGPVAAPAMLERVLAATKKSRGGSRIGLSTAVDSFTREDLDRLPLNSNKLPAKVAPVSFALAAAKSVGTGAWHSRFTEATDLAPSIEFEPIALATQIYRENLLGQLL